MCVVSSVVGSSKLCILRAGRELNGMPTKSWGDEKKYVGGSIRRCASAGKIRRSG